MIISFFWNTNKCSRKAPELFLNKANNFSALPPHLAAGGSTEILIVYKRMQQFPLTEAKSKRKDLVEQLKHEIECQKKVIDTLSGRTNEIALKRKNENLAQEIESLKKNLRELELSKSKVILEADERHCRRCCERVGLHALHAAVQWARTSAQFPRS